MRSILSVFRTKPRANRTRRDMAPAAEAAVVAAAGVGVVLLGARLYKDYKTRKLITTLRDLRSSEEAKKSAMRNASQADVNAVLRVFPAFVTLLEDEQLVSAVVMAR